MREYKDSSIKKLKIVKYKEKEEEIIHIPHKSLNDESELRKKSICDFILKEQLGEGTFGYVRLAINKQTGEKVAIKILDKKKILEYEDKIRVEREIKILKSLRHPNIVHLYSVLQTKDNLYIIMEYATGIELFEYIGSKKRIDEKTACHIYQQIISGLEYLHKNNIVHRDIKPENLIIDKKTKDLKIVDFGLSNIFNTEKTKMLSSSCGSPSYAAPEMLQGKNYNPQPVDIWSSGIVLYAMVCGFLPFEDENNDLLYRKICIGKYIIPDFISNKCKDLLKKLLVTDPNKRITIKQIKNHPWIKIYNNKGKLFFYEGLFIEKYIIPLDKEIIEKMSKEFDLNEDNIRLCILNNKHNDITTLYYLFLQKKINSNMKSIADLKSDLFKEYLNDKNNILNKENENPNNIKNKTNVNNKSISKDINNKTNYNFFTHIGQNKRLNSCKKRPVSYGEFDYKNNLRKSKQVNNLTNSNNDQISEFRNKNLLKTKNFIFENNNSLNEEEEYREKSERKKISKKEINIINKDKKRSGKNNHKDNEKLEKILSSLKKEIKNKYLEKNEIREENERNSKINNIENAIIKKNAKHSYINHLISNRKKIFSTIDWDENYQKNFNKENNLKKYNKNKISLKFQNDKEKLIENKNKNNMSLNFKRITNNNMNNENIFNNISYLSNEKNKKKSKNNISIIKDRKDTFSNSIIKTKYKNKKSVNRYNNRYKNIYNSKSPVRINNSCVDIISSDYDQLLTQNINTNTYNYNEYKCQTNYKNYLTSINEKEYKIDSITTRKNENSNKKKNKLNNKRDNKKILSNINYLKNCINKNSFQKFNLHLQSSFNEVDEINNNKNLYKNTSENNFEEIKITNEDNNSSTATYKPLSLSNIYITNKHTLKMEIDTILEELKVKYKNNGFSYLINCEKNDKKDKSSMRLKIKSYYNPSINIIKYSKNGCGNLFFYNIINKIQSKIKNV